MVDIYESVDVITLVRTGAYYQLDLTIQQAQAPEQVILGVDPGLTRCGIGIVDAIGGRRARLVHAGVIRSDSEEPLEQRLLGIARGLRAVLEEFAPDAVGVERVFSQSNISTVMGTAQVSGIARLEAAERGIPVALHTPS